jgi:hypothetical protein
MAVLGSNGVAWKVSSSTKSLDWGDCVGCAAGLRPVIESQLHKELANASLVHSVLVLTYMVMLSCGLVGVEEQVEGRDRQ